MAFDCVFVRQGDLAISFLEKMADAKVSGILNMKYEPLWDGIRQTPRFIALEKRVGIEP